MPTNPIRQLQGPGQQNPQSVVSVVDTHRASIEAALPEGINLERFIQIGRTAIGSNPDLQRCTRRSLLLSLLRCCQLGLEPSTPLGHSYIVPFGKEATVIVGYRGYVDLAWRCGILAEGHVVYEEDAFDVRFGTKAQLTHRPSFRPDRGEVVAAYGVARFADGRTMFEVMSRAELDAVMMKIRGKGNSGPWKDHRAEMQRKTAIRRLAKLLPLNPDRVGPAHARAAEDGLDGLDLPDVPADVPMLEAPAGGPLPPAVTVTPPVTGDVEFIVDSETYDLMYGDEVDWSDEDVKNAAMMALADAMREDPANADKYIRQNAKTIAGLGAAKEAALRTVAREAKANA